LVVWREVVFAFIIVAVLVATWHQFRHEVDSNSSLSVLECFDGVFDFSMGKELVFG